MVWEIVIYIFVSFLIILEYLMHLFNQVSSFYRDYSSLTIVIMLLFTRVIQFEWCGLGIGMVKSNSQQSRRINVKPTKDISFVITYMHCYQVWNSVCYCTFITWWLYYYSEWLQLMTLGYLISWWNEFIFSLLNLYFDIINHDIRVAVYRNAIFVVCCNKLLQQ